MKWTNNLEEYVYCLIPQEVQRYLDTYLEIPEMSMVRLPFCFSYQGEDLWLLGMDAVLQPDLATLHVLWQGEEYLLYPAWKQSKHLLYQAMALWDMLKVERE